MANEKININQKLQLLESLPTTSSCIVRDLIRANEIGMIVESTCRFDIGSSISFGFHVSSEQSLCDSEFIHIEALVVDSQKLLLTTDRDAYRTTVLYNGVPNSDRSKLIQFTRSTQYSTQASNIGLN